MSNITKSTITVGSDLYVARMTDKSYFDMPKYVETALAAIMAGKKVKLTAVTYAQLWNCVTLVIELNKRLEAEDAMMGEGEDKVNLVMTMVPWRAKKMDRRNQEMVINAFLLVPYATREDDDGEEEIIEIAAGRSLDTCETRVAEGLPEISETTVRDVTLVTSPDGDTSCVNDLDPQEHEVSGGLQS